MHSPKLRLLNAALTFLLLLTITSKQANAGSSNSAENEIWQLENRLCMLKIIDTSVYFIETYGNISPTYNINTILKDGFLKNQNELNFKRIIESSKCKTFTIRLNSNSSIKDFIIAYTDSLVAFEKVSYITEELKRDLCSYYHSAWNLFHHANKDHKDFDENLLSIYHIHRSYIGSRIDNRITELKQQIRFDSIQSKVYRLQTDIESSRLIGEVRFDNIDSTNRNISNKLDSILLNLERTHLIKIYFPKGKWLQRAQHHQLKPDTIIVLTNRKSFRKGKKSLKKCLKDLDKQTLKDTLSDSGSIRDLEKDKKNHIFTFRAEPNLIYPSNVNNRIAYFNLAVTTCQNLRPGDRVLVLIWDDWKTGVVFPHLITKR
jgi:hypothetical protein